MSRQVRTLLRLKGLAVIWGSHIGFDRVLGFGLKLPSGFNDTHLGALR